MPFESQKDPVTQAPIYSRRMNEVPFSANLPKMRKNTKKQLPLPVGDRPLDAKSLLEGL